MGLCNNDNIYYKDYQKKLVATKSQEDEAMQKRADKSIYEIVFKNNQGFIEVNVSPFENKTSQQKKQ